MRVGRGVQPSYLRHGRGQDGHQDVAAGAADAVGAVEVDFHGAALAAVAVVAAVVAAVAAVVAVAMMLG